MTGLCPCAQPYLRRFLGGAGGSGSGVTWTYIYIPALPLPGFSGLRKPCPLSKVEVTATSEKQEVLLQRSPHGARSSVSYHWGCFLILTLTLGADLSRRGGAAPAGRLWELSPGQAEGRDEWGA